MSYLETLPEDCPPEEAHEVRVSREVFRLARTNPITLADFRSQRAEKPNAKFNVSECRACGLSVYAARQDAFKASKLPTLRGRLVYRVRLVAGAGRIQQTGQPTHHTWWPFANFDILAHCDMEVV